MLSHKAKYALKALLYLAEQDENHISRTIEIADGANIPKKFLEQILLDLRNAGFLYSKKGAGGGYSLNKNPEDIFLVQILRITDGPVAMLPCASLNFYRKCDECEDEFTCGIRIAFIDVRDATLKILGETSIADIIAKETNLKLEAWNYLA